MLGFMVGNVFLDALVLCAILYAVGRYDADYDFQKVAMVVAATALGNMLISMALRQVLTPSQQAWLLPAAELVFSSFMIMTFCWVTFWKSMLVVVLFAVIHLGAGLGLKVLISKLAGPPAPPSLVERQDREVLEIKKEMERMARLEAGFEKAGTHADVTATNAAAVTNAAGVRPVALSTQTVAAAVLPEPAAPADVVTPPPAGPPAALAPKAAGDWAAARKQLKIGGVMGHAGALTALVNERMVSPGDVISTRYEGQTYRWTVREISRDGIKLEPRGFGPGERATR